MKLPYPLVFAPIHRLNILRILSSSCSLLIFFSRPNRTVVQLSCTVVQLYLLLETSLFSTTFSIWTYLESTLLLLFLLLPLYSTFFYRQIVNISRETIPLNKKAVRSGPSPFSSSPRGWCINRARGGGGGKGGVGCTDAFPLFRLPLFSRWWLYFPLASLL
jgi:hypothetical protein